MRFLSLLLVVATGCNSTPVADTLDYLSPSRPRPMDAPAVKAPNDVMPRFDSQPAATDANR